MIMIPANKKGERMDRLSLVDSHLVPNLIRNSSESRKLKIFRILEHEYLYPEIKDPSVVKVGSGSYMMFASIGNSLTQRWTVGRFIAVHPQGPWTELSPVIFSGINGRELCAPAVSYKKRTDGGMWTMYIQTSCFSEGGTIVKAESFDGYRFYGTMDPVVNGRWRCGDANIVGVYDAGISEISYRGDMIECLVFSGYRKIGCGDLYMTTRLTNSESGWMKPVRILAQEDVPFHNKPGAAVFEWGLEGAKVIGMGQNRYLLIGVCFLNRSEHYAGSKQRIMIAYSDNPYGPYIPAGTLIDPQPNSSGTGENGHPDTILADGSLWIVYQEREGLHSPWYLRSVRFDRFRDMRGNQISAGSVLVS